MGGPTRPTEFDWDDLRYFLAALRAGTFAGAARALGVEHSTIGRRLNALEHALGAPLFTRGPDGLSPTPLADMIAPLAAEVERAVGLLRDKAEGTNAKVRLAVPSAFARIFAPHLARLHAEHPGLTLELQSGSRMVDLKGGEADLAVRAGPSTDPDLMSRPLGESGWSLYASDVYVARRGVPASPRSLDGHEVLGFDQNLARAPGAQWLEAHGHGTKIVMRFREMADLAAACAAGLGVAVLPCLLADSEPGLRRLTLEVLGTQRIALVYRKETLLSGPVRIVADFVTAVVMAETSRLAGHLAP